MLLPSFFSLCLGLVLILIFRKRLGLPFAALVSAVAAVSITPLSAALSAVPALRSVSDEALFIGVFTALTALTLFERKDAPRRVPFWAGLALGLASVLSVPPLLDLTFGKYQPPSLRRDASACMARDIGPAHATVTNRCAQEIIVGLCQPDELNPTPCAQTVRLAPQASVALSPNGTALASKPGNLQGYTLAACHPPHRPSRGKQVGGRGYRGICLPALR